MIKAFIKYFLPLCILLVDGYSHMYANSYQDCISYSSVKNHENNEYTRARPVIKARILAFRYHVPGSASQDDKICIQKNEEETHELSFVKKSVENSHYFTSFHIRSIRYFRCNINVSSYFFELCSYYSSIRYIILRMIRI
ncbi:hypothetical protein [Dyadobacter bucti]|uniref:hypothetical protein n=1 Tax=Dyadobacter bucti TaxID=2572203 RepID=UPI003F709EDB